MKLAYVVFDKITWLDFIGIYDPLSRLKSLNYLPDLSWDICSYAESVQDNFALEIKVSKVNTALTGYDAIIVPGGYGTRTLMHNQAFIDWIKSGAGSPYKVSIC